MGIANKTMSKLIYRSLLPLSIFFVYLGGLAKVLNEHQSSIKELKAEKEEVINNYFYWSAPLASRGDTTDLPKISPEYSKYALAKVKSLDHSIDSLENASGRRWYSWAEPYIDYF